MTSVGEEFRKSMPAETYNALTEFDSKDPNVKKFIDEVHEKLIVINENIPYDKDHILIENRIFSIFASNPILTCQECASNYGRKFRKTMTEKSLRNILEDVGIVDDAMRAELLKWAQDTVAKFETALKSADEQNFVTYLNCFKESKREDKKRERREKIRPDELRRRIFCIMLFKKHKVLMSKEDFKIFEKFGNKYAKDLSFDINDILMSICGVESKIQKAVRIETEALRNSLNRQEIVNDTLKNDMQEQVHDERIKFFASLNSEKYGCILDATIAAFEGIKKLREQNFKLPMEINGIFHLVKKFYQFMDTNGIKPIMDPPVIKDMTVGEIEAWNAEYNGTPFTDSDEIKRVKVISPGWYYKDKEIQISPPKLLEYIEEE